MSVKVSVCITTYNQERFIEEAVLSALSQDTRFEFEVVVGEDASTDSTRAILERLQKAHPDRLRLLLQDRNVGYLRNQIDTHALCRGEYVALLDGDDVWLRADKLQRQADYLDAHPGISICSTSYTTGASIKASPRRQVLSLEDVISRGYTDDMLHSTIMLRRSCLPRLPDWLTLTRHEDLVIELLCLQHGKGAVLDDISTLYRQHDAATFSTLSEERRLDWDIDTWSELRKHVEPKFHRAIDRRLAGAYYRLAELRESSGQIDEAKSAFERAVKVGSLSDRIRHIGRAHAPSLHKWVLTAKSRLQYQARPGVVADPISGSTSPRK